MLDFQKKQYEFAKHIRDPENTPTPDGMEERRIKIYRELFFGNIKGLVSQTFPVLKKFYSEIEWDALIRKFMIEHEAKTPLFLEVSSEFIQFLQDTYQATDKDPAFMLELAHYEWAELAVAVMDAEIDLSRIEQDTNLLDSVPYISSTIWSLGYEFPVHRLGPNYAPTEKPEQPTFLLIYRKLNDQVEFMELNAVSARLIALLEEDAEKTVRRTGRELLAQIADEMQHPNPNAVIEGGLTLLQDFLTKEILLGSHKTN